MPDFRFTAHAKNMLVERNIPENWVLETISSAEIVENLEDGTRHYIKSIPEYEKRMLRVIVNPQSRRIITLFFDRRLRSTK